MKLSAIFLVGLSSGSDEPPRGHLKRLQGLVRGTKEILNSGAFNRKPKNWIKMWERKVVTNAERMEKSYNRGNQRCGEGRLLTKSTKALKFLSRFQFGYNRGIKFPLFRIVGSN